MRILALETTERTGSVAALINGKVLAELKLPPHQRSAESLAPGLTGLLAQVGWRPADVDLVATCAGPGSFTGLRVGVATAKVFAYCVGAEVLGLDTLEVIAARSPRPFDLLAAAVDAQRGQVVARTFRRDGNCWPVAAGPEQLVDVDAWLGGLAPGTAVTGPVLRKIGDRVPAGITVLDPAYWSPTASAVALLADRHYQAGRRDDLWALVPKYSRRSAAEEKWDARQKAKAQRPAD